MAKLSLSRRRFGRRTGVRGSGRRYGHKMAKRSTFTVAEIAEIKRIIREKRTAPGRPPEGSASEAAQARLLHRDYPDEPGFVERLEALLLERARPQVAPAAICLRADY